MFRLYNNRRIQCHDLQRIFKSNYHIKNLIIKGPDQYLQAIANGFDVEDAFVFYYFSIIDTFIAFPIRQINMMSKQEIQKELERISQEEANKNNLVSLINKNAQELQEEAKRPMKDDDRGGSKKIVYKPGT